jgi:hypothetical protein
MVDQSKIGRRKSTPLWLRIHLQIWKGKFPRLSPEFNGSLNLWRPEEVGLLRGLWRFWHHGSRTVHVVATNLVFGAVAALWEVFITTDVSLLARLATLSGLGMAAP